jgi:hypothetical protein
VTRVVEMHGEELSGTRTSADVGVGEAGADETEAGEVGSGNASVTSPPSVNDWLASPCEQGAGPRTLPDTATQRPLSFALSVVREKGPTPENGNS